MCVCVSMCAHAYVGLQYGLVCVFVHACGLWKGSVRVCVCARVFVCVRAGVCFSWREEGREKNVQG